MIRTIRNGITFIYSPAFKWGYINRQVVKIRDDSKQVGVNIIYPDGTRQWKGNSWYDKQDIENL